MSSEARSSGESEDDESAEDGLLLSLHRKYVGTPESRQEVYVGFGLFFAGVALGAIALVLFLYSGTQQADSNVFWQAREIALVTGLLALPAIATSVPVLLSVGRRTMTASLAGGAVCVVAVVWLTSVYPFDWTSAGNDVRVIGVYAVGLVLLVASTGSALVAQYIERTTKREDDRVETAAAVEQPDESVSDDQVESDIEEVMSESTLTWGGVEQEPTTKRLELNTPDLADDTDVDSPDVEAIETRSPGDDVDDAVDGLRQLQGGERETARTESPDDQVEALTEFRREQEDDGRLETGVETHRGLLTRVREKFLD